MDGSSKGWYQLSVSLFMIFYVFNLKGILYYFKKQPNKFTASEVVIPL